MSRRPDVLRVCSSLYAKTPRETRMAIVAIVAERYGVTVAEVMSRRKNKSVADARKAAMRAVSEAFGDSSPMIGRLFDRDHTTVLSALGTISKRKVAA